jgi:ribosomal protein S18 acetylase RimI-like enzyme
MLAAELLALQVAAYRVEAALIGSHAIPALHETPATLVAAGLGWIGCRDGEGLVGAAGITKSTEIIELDRLVVAPRAFRRGIGRRLLAAVVACAEHRSVVVSTGRDNVPARALYARAGFRETGQREVVPGLWTVSYTLDSMSSTSTASVSPG